MTPQADQRSVETHLCPQEAFTAHIQRNCYHVNKNVNMAVLVRGRTHTDLFYK